MEDVLYLPFYLKLFLFFLRDKLQILEEITGTVEEQLKPVA